MNITSDDMLVIGLTALACLIVLAVERRIQCTPGAIRRREARILRETPEPPEAPLPAWLRPGRPLTRMEKCDFAGLVEAYHGADAEPDRWLP